VSVTKNRQFIISRVTDGILLYVLKPGSSVSGVAGEGARPEGADGPPWVTNGNQEAAKWVTMTTRKPS